MGRIKTKLVKRKTHELMAANSESLTENFETNKLKVSAQMTFQSKKLRNIVAGYVTRLKKAQEEI